MSQPESPNGSVAPPSEDILRDFLVAVRRGLLLIVAVVDRVYPRPVPPDRCPRCDWRLRG
jgi:hypothetical protein